MLGTADIRSRCRSGQHTQPKKTRRADLASIVSKLFRDGLFQPECTRSGSLIWTNTTTGEQVGSISYEAHLSQDAGRVRPRVSLRAALTVSDAILIPFQPAASTYGRGCTRGDRVGKSIGRIAPSIAGGSPFPPRTPDGRIQLGKVQPSLRKIIKGRPINGNSCGQFTRMRDVPHTPQSLALGSQSAMALT
jgi:hypothetical protein